MPNHATNFVSIIGTPGQIDDLIDTAITAGSGGRAATLDFEKILPCPPELRATVSPVRVVPTVAEAAQINAWHLQEGEGTHWAQWWAIDQKEADRRFEAYGAGTLGSPILTWYEWCSTHWGTKWGAYEPSTFQRVEDTRLNLVFVTAWGAPTGIFDELGRRYDVQVHARTLVEGGWEDDVYGNPDEYLQVNRTIDFV